jgi:hypothetical protein
MRYSWTRKVIGPVLVLLLFIAIGYGAVAAFPSLVLGALNQFLLKPKGFILQTKSISWSQQSFLLRGVKLRLQSNGSAPLSRICAEAESLTLGYQWIDGKLSCNLHAVDPLIEVTPQLLSSIQEFSSARSEEQTSFLRFIAPSISVQRGILQSSLSSWRPPWISPNPLKVPGQYLNDVNLLFSAHWNGQEGEIVFGENLKETVFLKSSEDSTTGHALFLEFDRFNLTNFSREMTIMRNGERESLYQYVMSGEISGVMPVLNYDQACQLKLSNLVFKAPLALAGLEESTRIFTAQFYHLSLNSMQSKWRWFSDQPFTFDIEEALDGKLPSFHCDGNAFLVEWDLLDPHRKLNWALHMDFGCGSSVLSYDSESREKDLLLTIKTEDRGAKEQRILLTEPSTKDWGTFLFNGPNEPAPYCQVDISHFKTAAIIQTLCHFIEVPPYLLNLSVEELNLRGELYRNQRQSDIDPKDRWSFVLKNCALDGVKLSTSAGTISWETLLFEGRVSSDEIHFEQWRSILDGAEGIVTWKQGRYVPKPSREQVSVLPSLEIHVGEVFLQQGTISNSWFQLSCGPLEGHFILREYDGEIGSATCQVVAKFDETFRNLMAKQGVIETAISPSLSQFLDSSTDAMLSGSILWVDSKESVTVQGQIILDQGAFEEVKVPFQLKSQLRGLSSHRIESIAVQGWELNFCAENISSNRFVQPFIFDKGSPYTIGGTLTIEGKVNREQVDLRYLPRNFSLTTPYIEIQDIGDATWAEYHINLQNKNHWGEIPLKNATVIEKTHQWQFDQVSGSFMERNGHFDVQNLSGYYLGAHLAMEMMIELGEEKLKEHASRYQNQTPQVTVGFKFKQCEGSLNSLQHFFSRISRHPLWGYEFKGGFTIPDQTSNLEVSFFSQGSVCIDSHVVMTASDFLFQRAMGAVEIPFFTVAYTSNHFEQEPHIKILPYQGRLLLSKPEKKEHKVFVKVPFQMPEVNITLKSPPAQLLPDQESESSILYDLDMMILPSEDQRDPQPLAILKMKVSENQTGVYRIDLRESGSELFYSPLESLSMQFISGVGLQQAVVKGSLAFEKLNLCLEKSKELFVEEGIEWYQQLSSYLKGGKGEVLADFSLARHDDEAFWDLVLGSRGDIEYMGLKWSCLDSTLQLRNGRYICKKFQLDDLSIQGVVSELAPKLWRFQDFDLVWGQIFEASVNASYDQYYEKLKLDILHSQLRWEESMTLPWMKSWGRILPGQGEVEMAGEIILEEIGIGRLPALVDYELILNLEEFTLGELYYSTKTPIKIMGDAQLMRMSQGEVIFFVKDKFNQLEPDAPTLVIEEADLDLTEGGLELHRVHMNFFPEELGQVINALPLTTLYKKAANKFLNQCARQQEQRWSGGGSYGLGGQWQVQLHTQELSISLDTEGIPGNFLKLKQVSFHSNASTGVVRAIHQIPDYPLVYQAKNYWQEERGSLSVYPAVTEEELDLLEEELGDLPEIILQWHRDRASLNSNSKIIIDSIQGALPGVEVKFLPSPDLNRGGGYQVLSGMAKIELLRAKELVQAIAPALLSNRTMYQKPPGEILLDAEVSIHCVHLLKSYFKGHIEASGGCRYFPYHQLSAEVNASLEKIEVKELEMGHFGSKFRCQSLQLVKDLEKRWLFSIPKMVCYDLFPRQVTEEFPIENGMCFSYIEVSDVKGRLREPESWTGHGSLSFEKRTKKHWMGAVFFLPKEFLSALSLGSEVATPVQGGCNFTINKRHLYLGQLLNTYSERKKAQFFLTTLSDMPIEEQNRVSFDGDLSLAIRIKQRTLLKLGQLFLVQVGGNVKRPIYRLRSNRSAG